MVLQVPADLTTELLASVLQAVLDHHGMLRARLRRADGWALEVPPPGAVRAAGLVERVEVGANLPQAVDSSDGTAVADGAGIAVRGDTPVSGTMRRSRASRGPGAVRLSRAAGRPGRNDRRAPPPGRRPAGPEEGRMLQAVWLDAGRSVPGRLVLVAHHLVVDGVSWRILLADLAQAARSLAAGQPVTLPPVGTSFPRWSRMLAADALTASRRAELESWREMLRERPRPSGCGRWTRRPTRRRTNVR
nr:hypothetical protein GCM10020093_070590 [Planobispora longispora]